MSLHRLPIEAKREALALLEAKAHLRRRREADAERERILNQAESIRARCTTLAGFVREAWHVLEPNTPYVHGWHIDALCLHLEAISHGRINRLLINVPPGTAKSLIISVFWPAWEWGPLNQPGLRYLTSSYAEDYAKRDSRRMRDLVSSEWFQALWPLQLIRAGEMSFENAARGGREGKPFASMTSGRGDRVLIDDPHSTETAESDAERARTTRIFRESITSRLNDPVSSAIVVIMQRLNEEDVSGVILKLGLGYEHLCLPMEFETGRRCTTSIGFTDPRTYEGELLFPERFPRQVVDRDKRAMGAYAAAGQYQQRPGPREGAFFVEDWFNRYASKDRPASLRIYGTSDYAVKADAGDYTVHRIWGVAQGGDIYLLDGWRGQATSDVWIERKLDLIAKWKPGAWFGEGGVIRHAIEPALIRRARERKVYARFEWLSSVHDKATRARGFQARAAMGGVFAPEGGVGDAWIAELVAFPGGAHDDEVDAASLLGRALDEAHPATATTTRSSQRQDRWAAEDEGSADGWKTR